MKFAYVAIAASAITVGATPSLAAAKFAPANTNFTVTGSLSLQQSQGSTGFDCPFTFAGLVTRSGEIKIKRATFCANVQASGLPWVWQALQVRGGRFFMPMTLIINGFNCGPWNGDGLDESGVLVVAAGGLSANGCIVVSGGGPSTPTITIVR